MALQRRHRILEALAALFALVAVLGCAARLLPMSWQTLPWVPVIVAATPWFTLVALLSLLLSLVTHRWFTFLVAAGCIALEVFWQMPYFVNGPSLGADTLQAMSQPRADTSDNVARVMTANVYKGQADAQQVVDLVRDQHVEVLALQETTDDFVAKLDEAGLSMLLPYSVVASSDGVYGNGLWSATPLGNPQDAEFNSSASFMPAGTVAFDQGRLSERFVSVHTTSPNRATWKQWSTSVDELRTLTGKSGYVLMGDFNATTDHAVFRHMLGADYQDATVASGHGMVFTWPMDRKMVPAGACLDHIVVGKDVTVGQVEAKTIAGSDHRALLATLQFPEAGE